MKTEIAPRATIGQLVGLRDRALEAFRIIHDNTAALNEIAAQLNPKHKWSTPRVLLMTGFNDRSSASIEDYRAELDRGAWTWVFDATELSSLMDAKQREKWREDVSKNPPEFTMENVVATFEDLRARSGEIFLTGLVNVFEKLPRSFRSHDGFKIGARCVLEFAVTPPYSRRGHFRWAFKSFGYGRDQLDDLDRVFHLLAEEEWTTKAGDLASSAMQDGEGECETRFFKLRWFKNGNCHVWMTDEATTRAANKLLAQHYGAALGHMAA